MKNIVITGGRGYIGENLVRRLKKYYDLVIVDVDNKDYKLNTDCGGVVHLAALSGILACQDDPYRAIEDNIGTAQNFFQQASNIGVPVVFTSSQSAKNPNSSFYATIKRTIEMLAQAMNENGADIRVLRLANVYGGYKYLQKKNSVIKLFTKAVEEGEPIVIDGDGSQTRDFIHVYDVCDYIEGVLFSEDRIEKPLDIGTGIATSIKELAEMFNYDNIVYSGTRGYGSESSIADTTEAEKIFGYKGCIRLEDVIGGSKDNS